VGEKKKKTIPLVLLQQINKTDKYVIQHSCETKNSCKPFIQPSAVRPEPKGRILKEVVVKINRI
jgi:hypothetical protein